MQPGIYLLKQEFGPAVGIPNNQIDRRKTELYEWLKNFFDYEILDGCPIRIKINEVIGEYQPLPRKKYSSVERDIRIKEARIDYEDYTISALSTEFKPNSMAKIARDAIDDFGYEKYSHTSQEAVAKRFIKPAFNIHAETNNKYLWAWYSSYTPINGDALSRWKQILKEEHISEEEAANAFYKQERGEDISKEKQYYQNALARFKGEFHDIPVRVREWRKVEQ